MQAGGDNELMICGDFNAANQAWGYSRTNIKGRELLQDALEAGLSLITDPAYPTRTGSSVTRDTTPDLTFFRGIGRTGAVGWRNTGQDLGSDHFIVEATIPITRPGSHTERKKHRITNWDAFREALGSWQSEITDIDQWTDRVIRTMEATTKEVEA